jgi:DNA primase
LIAEIRERADIVGIVGRYVTLKKSGPRHWGLCPFHSEKTASFQVHEEKQIFHCFGCGVGGDVFSFRTRHDGLDFPDAVRAIAREVGVEIPERGDVDGGSLTPLYRANESALDYFLGVLRADDGARARRYLRSRGITRELAQRFQIGAAPAKWDGLLRHLERAGQPPAAAEKAGLVAQRRDGDGRYDRFRGRVIFPILDPSGRVLGFGGRQLDDEDGTPKYLNTSETPVYRKSRVLFGLPQALDAIRSAGRVVVVEGYFDVLALHRAGIEQVVAPCGTALTSDHGKRIRRYAPEVVLLFDGDEAGRQAAERALPTLLAEGLRVRAAFLAPGDDPDTLLEREGPEALRACLEDAVPLLRHLMDRQFSRKTREQLGTADVAHVLAPLLEAVSDPLERRDHVHEVATYLRLEDAELDEAVRSYTQSRGTRETPKAPARHIEEEEVKIDAVSRALLEAAASHPDLVGVIGHVRLEWLPPGDGRELLGQLLSRAPALGSTAVSWLCSEEAEELRPGLKAALRRIVMQAGSADRASALQAVRDCLARLEDRALEQEMRDLRSQIETCRDPAERETLLERVQATLERRRTLTPTFA